MVHRTTGTGTPRALPLVLGLGAGIVGLEALRRSREVELTGQVALVTGGSRGLGLELARELLRRGCRVAICARDQDELDRARGDLAQDGADVVVVRCDVADRFDVERMVRDLSRCLGEIDLLVNNAGVIVVGPVQSMTHEDFERALAIDFWGVVNPTLAVLPSMRARGSGRIVNITSIGGRISTPHLLPYNAAKFAAVGLSEGLRAELAAEGITVTTVVPGEMRTGSHLHAEFSGHQEAEYRWFALGASSPMAVPADRAARSIVRAVRRGKADHTFPLSAVVLTRLHGLFPGAAANVLGAVNRLMPGPDGAGTDTANVAGAAIDHEVRSPVFDALTILGRAAARRFNQAPERAAAAASPADASHLPASP